MRVEIDRDLCMGSGMCEAVDPAVFEIGDDGIAIVLTDAVDIAVAEEAVRLCPNAAIRVIE